MANYQTVILYSDKAWSQINAASYKMICPYYLSCCFRSTPK